MNPETKEISSGYREGGYFAEAFTNMLVFLGWNPGTTQELFSMEALAEAFSLDRVGKAGAKFDFDKTKWFNQQYLRAKSPEDLADLVAPFNEGKEIVPSIFFVPFFHHKTAALKRKIGFPPICLLEKLRVLSSNRK